MFNNRFMIFVLALLCFGSVATAQVLVHKEPKHHPIFENQQIRILDVVMAPGDSSIFHIHHTPSLFIFFTNTTTGQILQGKSASFGTSVKGTMRYENLSAPNTRTHRVWNPDKDTFHVMDIELLGKYSGYALPPIAAPGLFKQIDTAWTRAYKLTLEKGQEFQLNEKKRAFVLVSYSKASVATSIHGNVELKEGGYIEVPRGKHLVLRNKGEVAAEFAVLELPHQ